MTPTCTYCGRKIEASDDEIYRAIEGWETVDGSTDLQWVTLDRFACRSCVDEHFIGLDRDVEEE